VEFLRCNKDDAKEEVKLGKQKTEQT